MMLKKLEWESIEQSDILQIKRSKVPNGWLVIINKSSCYVPDKDHSWLKNVEMISKFNDKNLIDKLFIKIDDLNISLRAKNVLKIEGITFVGDIVCSKEIIKHNNFLKIQLYPNLGKKSYTEIINVLRDLGFNEPLICNEYWNLRATNEYNK